MAQKLCWVTITDIQGGGRVVEVKASSLFEAVAQAVKLKCGRIATDGFRPTDQGPCLRTKGRRRGKAEGFHGVARPKQPIAAGDDKSYEDQGITWSEEDELDFARAPLEPASHLRRMISVCVVPLVGGERMIYSWQEPYIAILLETNEVKRRAQLLEMRATFEQ